MSKFLVKFEIGGGDPRTPNNENEEGQEETWECIWKCHTAAPVHHMAFSPDGTLFATSGRSDRLVKVWYENKHCELNEIHEIPFQTNISSDFSAVSVTKPRTQSIDGKFHRQSD